MPLWHVPQRTNAWPRASVAWAAGVLEGEGSFILKKADAYGRRSAVIACEMTDSDVVRRLADVFGVGRVTSKLRKEAHRKEMFLWQVAAQADVQAVLAAIYEFMGQRRTIAIEKMLHHLANSPSRAGLAAARTRHFRERAARRTHCRNGHEFSAANTARDEEGARVCIACRRAKQARYDARRRAHPLVGLQVSP